MQSVKILHSSKHVSLFCVPQAGESGGLSGGRTVPTSHCPEARWQDNPGAAATPSRAAVMRGDRAAISDADGHTGRGKGIPRALMRNTTITRLPRSIATAFPSATRGRCVHERDRRFESVSLLRGAIFANLIPRPGRITGNRRFESSSLQRRIRRTPTRTGEVPSDLEVVRYWDLAATERTKLNDRTRRSAPRSATTRTVANPGAGRQERSEPSKRSL